MSTHPHDADTAAFYSDTVHRFHQTDDATILGHLAGASSLSIDPLQTDAWRKQIRLLKDALSDVDGSLFLEFDIPRLGSRIDGVVVSPSAIVPIEFKVGEQSFNRADYNQAWDYALDLKNFHEASSSAPIFPVLCATEATAPDDVWESPHADGVYPPIRANAATVGEAVRSALVLARRGSIDAGEGRTLYQYALRNAEKELVRMLASIDENLRVQSVFGTSSGA